ncbi:MAG: PadR family transcriptional regulator [Gemmatimonadota bacterium]
MAKDSVGEFEHQLLLAALRTAPDAYTATIVMELEACAGRTVSPAAVHIALGRLEEHGLIASELRDGDGATGRRQRRYVSVTPHGLAVVRAERARLLRLWAGLEPLLERN